MLNCSDQFGMEQSTTYISINPQGMKTTIHIYGHDALSHSEKN